MADESDKKLFENMFDEMDLDGNGKLTSEEFAIAM